MIFKNSYKILFSKFNLTWRVMLHLLISTAITFGLCVLCAMPIVNVLKAEGFFNSFQTIRNSFFPVFSLDNIVNNSLNTINMFFEIISKNFNSLAIFIFLFLFVLFIVGGFLRGLHRMPTSNMLYLFMSSNAKISYTVSFFTTLKQNLIFELMASITILPINILMVALMVFSLNLFSFSAVATIVVPFILMFIILILNALKLALFNGWIPAIVCGNKGVLKGLKLSLTKCSRNFVKVFSNAILLIISVIAINLFVSVFTIGVGLIITIPATYLLISIFNMVAYFDAFGNSYYTEQTNVVIPKKMEQTEEIRKIKYIL